MSEAFGRAEPVEHGELARDDHRLTASIDESRCIGCTLCIEACPVDAIAGAAKLMHTVIARECTGCVLCVPACPVDCIAMVESVEQLSGEEIRRSAERAQRRALARQARLGRRLGSAPLADAADKRSAIERAITRAKSRLTQRK